VKRTNGGVPNLKPMGRGVQAESDKDPVLGAQAGDKLWFRELVRAKTQSTAKLGMEAAGSAKGWRHLLRWF
jgi:hypothetical protein